MEESIVLKSEARLAMAKINRNKTAGRHQIVIEMLTVLDNFRNNKDTKMIIEIYDRYD